MADLAYRNIALCGNRGHYRSCFGKVMNSKDDEKVIEIKQTCANSFATQMG